MKSPATALLFAVLLATSLPFFHESPLDTSFGDGRMRYFGFQSDDGNNDDEASVACPGPDRSLMITGRASNGQRIVTARLLSSGDPDVSSSGDGKETFNLIGDGFYPKGVCQPNGDMLAARPVAAAGGEQLFRDGAPRPGFAGRPC
ncbi:MAG: hypothetical protein JNN30_19675 [Rhodanobacteraceae bacterium]|nr:hypothetical protein [Rhodanobacteraceae bacterium]